MNFLLLAVDAESARLAHAIAADSQHQLVGVLVDAAAMHASDRQQARIASLRGLAPIGEIGAAFENDLAGAECVIVGFHEVDSMDGTGIEEIKAAIADAASQLPQMGESFNPNWKAARDEVLALRKENPHIPFDKFKETLTQSAVTNFGSGWTWLVKNEGGELEILNTSNAGNPLTEGKTPLITCDVWEHAYYIDYRNARPKYVEAYWELVNWEFAAKNFGG